jgi:predicted enzyme related to lactoylglutathione lyase
MNRPVHFEIHAADPERTAEFYREVFAWDIREWTIPGVPVAPENRYWLVTTGATSAPGINGGIIVRRGPAPAIGQPVNAFVCTIGVASLDEAMASATSHGATLALPKMPIKGVGWLAYCHDPAGNLFGMMQEDPSAA